MDIPGPSGLHIIAPRPEHPLSPGAHQPFPSLARRSTSVHLPSASAPPRDREQGQPQGYFDLSSTSRHVHAPSISSAHGRRHAASDADLLGIGPSQRLSRRAGPSNKPSPAVSDVAVLPEALSLDPAPTVPSIPLSPRSTLHALDSLSKDEVAILDTRFDLMSDDELRIYLEHFGAPPPRDSSTDLPTPKVKPGTPPKPHSPALMTGDKTPLFPPSPPSHATHREVVDHPLRILSRAVRELREANSRLEEENERLRLHLERERESKESLQPKQADEISIHDNLTEALSTSLTSNPLLHAIPPPRAPSPAPSTRSARPRSPASSASVPYISTPTNRAPSIRSVDVGTPGTPRRKDRSSWTANLWGWGQKRPSRTRRGSVGSIASQGIPTVPESALVDDDDEEAWRRGDGGSSPAFRAIFLATRIITPDPSSILVSTRIPANSLIAYLAHTLVSHARDQGIVAQEPPSRRRSSREARSRAASIASQGEVLSGGTGTGTPSQVKGYGDQALAATASLGRSLLSSVSSATMRGTKTPATSEDTVRPSLLSRVSSSKPYPTTAITAPPVASGSSAQSSADESPPPSVELSSIVPDEARPPTVLLSRRNLGSFFQSSKAVPTLRTATRFNSKDPPLTDRYGFIYDIQHASMLKDASEAGTPAPASLNGTIPPTPSDVGWIDKRRQSQNGARSSGGRSGSRSPVSPEDPTSPRKSIDSAMSSTSLHRSRTPDSLTPPTSRSQSTSDPNRHRPGPTLNLNPSAAKPVTAKDTLTVSSRGATSLQPGVVSSSPLSGSLTHDAAPAPSASVSRLTVSSLLDQLTDIHDQQQKERTTEWDAFIRKRKGRRSVANKGDEMRWGGGLVGISQIGPGAEEWKAFTRLVRRGIPLAYRADIWAECSGAKDAMVPGEYAEILAVHADDTSPFLAEIDKDVSRTFPGNVFFGGDGPGVAKLRRVLVAYSWHNPAMLAATLLLTHTEEEQAYWVLLSVIERLLPKDFFSPSLIASRADQAVLDDLVRQLVPRVHAHLVQLGVDLASVTFGWFLSIFTDCLPVETLFRVWDIFFVEGHDTLFRVAIAIIKLAENDLCGCESVSDLFAFVGGMTSRLWAADKLIALQHNYKPIIRHADLVARCEKQLAALQQELQE